MPQTIGTPFLTMPNFSVKISSKVLPSTCIWSKATLVIIERMGVITLVASNLPPIPTSIMAKSKSSKLAKYKKARTVINSKKVGSSYPLCSMISYLLKNKLA